MNNDLISRQAAVDALDELCDRECEYSKKQRSVMCGACHLGSAFDVIEQLPSAQPEIIRCKDCKHWMPYDWMFSEVWQSQNMDDYPEKEIGCQYRDMSMGANDFCSRAERREE